MAYPDYLRQRARELRLTKKLTLDEIAERLALPKTTVYYWITDLPLGRPRSTLAQQLGTAAMQAKYQHLREEAYSQGRLEYDELVKLPTFRDFVVLYIAEGYKRGRNRVSIGNSDARVIQLTDCWLRRLTTARRTYAVQYHADQDLEALTSFWGATLGVDPTLIRLQRKSNSGQLKGRRWRSVNGVLTITVGATLLRVRLRAWIDRIKDEWV
jgi:transposase-like protein